VRLCAIGIDASPERVQSFREVGLLVAPESKYRGGGGRVGRYPGEALERTRVALELSGRYPLYQAVLLMFVQGTYEIPIEKLRRAARRLVSSMRRDLARAAGSETSGDPPAAAAAIGETLAKRVMRDPLADPARRRIKRTPDRRREDVIAEIMTDAAGAIAYEMPVGPSVLRDAADLLGATDIVGPKVADEMANLAPQIDQRPMQIDALEHAVREASMGDFKTALTDARKMLDATSRAGATVALFTGQQPRDGTLLPATDENLVLVVLHHLSHKRIDPHGYATDKRLEQSMSAPTHLLQLMPEYVRTLSSTNDDLSQLTPAQRHECDLVWAQFTAEFPDEAVLLVYPWW